MIRAITMGTPRIKSPHSASRETIAAITSVEADHLDIYGSLDAVLTPEERANARKQD